MGERPWLTLARKKGEDVVLRCEDGTVVVVRVKKTGQHMCRLAISAPRSVRIDRGEKLDPEELEVLCEKQD